MYAFHLFRNEVTIERVERTVGICSRNLILKINVWRGLTWGAKDACALMLCVEDVSVRRKPQCKETWRYNFCRCAHASFALTCFEKPIMVGQVVYPKTIGKNNSCDSLYSEQLETYHKILDNDVGQPKFCSEALSLLHQVDFVIF